ncbi:MAG: lytic transglycosylase domain-containing protein [Acidiferrobacterales bacterium]
MAPGSGRAKRGFVAVLAAAGFCLVSVAHAQWYVYQRPDGSRLLSDHAVGDSRYQLIRESNSVRGMGALLARRGAPSAAIAGSGHDYDRLIRRDAAAAHVSVALVKAVVHAESGFNPGAVSPKGASGLMQLMPATAERYGVRNVFNPAQNVGAGVRYLRDLLVEFDGNHRLALAAYNAGASAVLRYRGVPPFNETQTYVRRVMHYRNRYVREEFNLR